MQYPTRELADRLAAEYVLGTLRGAARSRFERWLVSGDASHQAMLQTAVRRWEDRLVQLADDVTPVQPSPRVWRAIEQRTTSRGAHTTWRAWALAASVAIVALATWLWSVREPAVAWQPAAQLADAARPADLWRVDVDALGERLRLQAVAPYPATERIAHELWALPSNGGAPVSLGLLPQRGELVRELTAAQRAALAAAAQFAVSREPAGGSPTGAPTGPVLVVVARLRGA
jgi:anti-sigma-K factor RskA